MSRVILHLLLFRQGNGYKIWHYTGALLHEKAFSGELWPVWRIRDVYAVSLIWFFEFFPSRIQITNTELTRNLNVFNKALGNMIPIPGSRISLVVACSRRIELPLVFIVSVSKYPNQLYSTERFIS